MAILNYTTSIDAHKTVGEIQVILVKHGARSIIVEYDAARNPCALTFDVEINGDPVNFRLPSNYNGVRNSLNKSKVPPKYRTDAQAVRVAWRILKDWVEAQMAIIEAGLATTGEVFMPYAVMSNGQTMYQQFIANPSRLLGA